MKRILMGFILCVLPMVAGATDMCARDDIMVMVFDPQVTGTNNGVNIAEWSWWAQFPYGRIAGEATCLSKTEGLGQTATQGAYYGTGTYASTFITADSGLSGTDDAGEERKSCWCKMTYPAVSRWVFYYTNSSASACASHCASSCGNNVRHAATMRVGLFGSIGL